MHASADAPHCGTPRIALPADALVLADRPVVSWQAVEGADHYRVQVSLRVPDGPLLGSLDLIVREPRFELPQALSVARALVVAKVTAHCGDKGYGEPSDPALGGRFLAMTGQTCPAPGPIRASIDGGSTRLAWDRIDAATGYEVTRYDVHTGRQIERVRTGQAQHTAAVGTGEAGLFAVRTLCGDRSGHWSYALLR